VPKDPAFDPPLVQIRSRLLDDMHKIIIVLAVPALAASLYRIQDTGWTISMFVHIAAAILVWCLFLFRNEVRFSIRSSVLLSLFLILGINGFLNYGLCGAGPQYVIVFVILATLFSGLRGGLSALAASMILMIGLSIAVIQQWLTFPIDFKVYNEASSSWILLIARLVLLIGAAIIVADRLYSALMDAMSTAQRQTNEIQQRAVMLEAEIAERKRAEEALRESEERYRNGFENHNAVMLLIDPDDGSIIEANKAAVNYYGWPYERLKQMKIQEINTFSSEDIKRMMNHAQPQKPIHSEFRHRRADGLIRDVEVFSSKINVKGKDLLHSIIHDITTRKQAEDALRESEEKYRLMAENTADIISINDMSLRFTYISPSVKRLRGFNVDEAVHQTLEQTMTPESLKTALAAFEEEIKLEASGTADPNRIRTLELEEYKKDGSIIPLESSLSYLRDRDGKPVGILAISRDITDRRRGEEALRRSEEATRRLAMENEVLAEIGRIISSTVDIEEVYEHFAREAKRIIPFDRITVSIFNLKEMNYFILYTAGVEVPGFHTGDCHPIRTELLERAGRLRPGIIFQVRAEHEGQGEEEIRRQLPSFLPLYQAGLRSFMRVPLISKDEAIGSLNFLSLKYEAYSESDLRLAQKIANQIAGAVASTLLFHKQKQTEAQLLEASERFRRLVELSPLMISIQKAGKYVYLNPAALKTLGASKPEELVGRSIFEMIHPDYWDAARKRFEIVAQGKPVTLTEEKVIRLDKKVIDVELSQIQVFDRDEHAVMVVGRDITEQKKAEREKAALQEQLQQAQKMEAIGTLAGGIAHDFNNILAGIMGYAELAGLDLPEGSKAKENLQNSIKSAHRAKNLVQQILAFSRQKKQERRPIDIRPIIKEGVKFLRASLPTTIEIRQEMEEDLGTIEADPTQIHQVLMNLCMNASQAMGDQGGVLEVSLEKIDLDEGRSPSTLGLEPGPYLRLRVSDTGHGIPPEVLPRIFDPYFTTKEVGKGTGLGLAVVHGILKSYGGGISVSSEVGKGSSFGVYFPRIEAPSPTLEAVQAEPLPPGRKERVLFVDDEQAIVEIGQKILEYLGYEAVVRTSSLEALELFRAKPYQFDLVITDMTMPNMTGAGLAHEILGIRPGMPIILCTGFSEQMSGEKAKGLGIREFVMKPLVVMDLAKAMRRALDSEERKNRA